MSSPEGILSCRGGKAPVNDALRRLTATRAHCGLRCLNHWFNLTGKLFPGNPSHNEFGRGAKSHEMLSSKVLTQFGRRASDFNVSEAMTLPLLRNLAAASPMHVARHPPLNAAVTIMTVRTRNLALWASIHRSRRTTSAAMIENSEDLRVKNADVGLRERPESFSGKLIFHSCSHLIC